MTYNTFSFKVTKTSMWFFKIGSFSTYFTRIPPPPLLLRLGFAPWVVSPDVDLFKWCQKKRITKGYHLKLYFTSQDASQVSEKPKQRCPSRSRFGDDCSGISGSPCYHCNFGFIFPGQLKYHMKRVATKEKVVGLFMSCLVRAWRCRALMWVFISIQIWSCNYIFTKWCNYIFTRWYRMKCNTKGKSCTTWQDMFGHRLPQNRGPKMLIFSFCWRDKHV